MNLAPRKIEAALGQMAGSQLAGLTDLRRDTVSPHDEDALEALFDSWTFQDHLTSLVRGAVQSRRLADEHRYAAREFVRAARSAHERGSTLAYRNNLAGARDAHRKAHKCCVYARRCEDQANAIALSSGFRPAMGH